MTGRPAVGRPEPGPLARCVGDPDVFAARYWGRAPLLTRNATGGFRDLLDLDGVDELLSRRGLRTPFLRMAKDGPGARLVARSPRPAGSAPRSATRSATTRWRPTSPTAPPSCCRPCTAPGRPLIEFCTRLAAELGHPVQANAYVTPPSSRGFSAHYDVHDVFVLQLAGRKHWTIHAPVLADPLRDQPWSGSGPPRSPPRRRSSRLIDTVLEPGDALYLPRGWLHAATALGEVSAHLTVGIHVVTRFALVEALAALVADDPALRATLPLGIDVADPAALAPHLDAVRAALAEALCRVPDEAVARRVRRRVWSGGRPEPVGVVAGTAFAAGLASGDVVRLRVGLHHRLRPAGEHVVLELPDREISLPAFTEAAVRALTRGTPVAVGSLPGMEEADQIVLVRRLLREGVVVPAGRT